MKRLCALLPMLLVIAALPVVLSGCEILVDANTTWGATTISSEDVLRFDPTKSATLTMTGNLVINGELEMHPNPGVVHKIVFANANESQFVGGGETVQPNDDGLWVMGSGVLDVSGSPKEPFGRLAPTVNGGLLAQGVASFTLDRDPTGWRVGDAITIAPTAFGDYDNFDTHSITAINGRVITMSTGAIAAHPAITLPNGSVQTAEVLNLTRNVQIEGKPPAVEFPNAAGANPTGRSHIFIQNNSATVQKLNYAQVRYMGPRKYLAGPDASRFVLGRYPIHFHHNGNFSNGSTVTGTVVRDSGSHAFVAHMSNGVTFTKTIAFDNAETPYWWDVKADEESWLENERSENVTYNNTIAARVDTDSLQDAPRLSGYSASCGNGNKAINAIAIGVHLTQQTSGLLWPEGGNDCPNTWTVTNFRAHNNSGDAFFTWANDADDPHDKTNGLVAYRNGGACIENGAYRNAFDYGDVQCVDNDGAFHPAQNAPTHHAAFVLHAVGPLVGSALDSQIFKDIVVRGNGKIYNAVRVKFHQNAGGKPVELRRWDVAGLAVGGNAVGVEEAPTAPGAGAGFFDFICWTLPGGAELQPTDFQVDSMHPFSQYRVQRRNGTAYQVHPNGSTTVIPAFAPTNCSDPP